MTMKYMMVGLMMEDVQLFIKIPYTLPFKITYKVLMVMVEVDVVLMQSPLPPII